MNEYNKNRGIQTDNARYSQAVFFCLLLMLISLAISRAALSISMMIFFILAMAHKSIVRQIITCFQQPLLIAFSFLFFIPFISGIWSYDMQKWGEVIKMKLPLLLFPIAFAGRWKLTIKQWSIIAATFIFLVTVGCVWSLAYYLQHINAIHESYLQAKTIPTPLDNDHVRFSWIVSIAAVLCLYWIQFHSSKKIKYWLLASLLFFVAYLHILSARTGILVFYIFLGLYAGFMTIKKLDYRKAILLLLAIVMVPVLAYITLPTLKARVNYMLYDVSLVQKKQYVPGSNDGARVMSLQAGWQVLRQNPLGAGAGDVMHEADKWYAIHVPQVIAADKFPPLSEWLLYGGFAGWPGVLLFTISMLAPLFTMPNRNRFFWIAFHIMAAFSFVFDTGLEVQYGIFIYAFTFFCWWGWLTQTQYDQ